MIMIKSIFGCKAKENPHPQEAQAGNPELTDRLTDNAPEVTRQSSINFNGDLGFVNYYCRFVKQHEGLPLPRSYEIAAELYSVLSSKEKAVYGEMGLLDHLDVFDESDGCAGMDSLWDSNDSDGCAGMDSMWESDDDERDAEMVDACDKKPKCGCGCECGQDCPKKRRRSTCIEPGICDSIGFKNFLAAFRCKNDQLSRCSGLALAKQIYAGMNECDKKAFRAQGCIPPRCKKSCIPFRPITNAKRRPKCKPCGF